MTDQSPNSSGPSPFVGAAPPRSVVTRRPSSLPLLLGGTGIALLAVLVFSSLSSSRVAQVATDPQTNVPASAGMPPMMLGAPNAVMMPPAVTQPGGPNQQDLPPLALMPGSGSTVAMGDPVGGAGGANPVASPAVVIDLASGAEAPALPKGRAEGEKASGQADKNETGEERFASRLASTEVETVAPTALHDRALIAPQGTIIPAVMETAINSDLPGYVRAVVIRDVRGFDGSKVVIPRGSRLVGQYRNAVAMGQSRAFVVWSRMLTPDGLSIDIQSPGSDRLGRSGTEGESHSHFLRRFGNAILLSILNAGLQAAGTRSGNNTSIVIGSSQQASNIATLALQKEIDIPTTVTVKQGTAINVFVSRDLDFSSVAGN